MGCTDYINHKDLPQSELHVPKTHTHTTAAITDLAITAPVTNDVLVYNQSTGDWENVSIATLVETYLIQTEYASHISGDDYSTTNAYTSGTLIVWLNGLKVQTNDLTFLTDTTFQFNDSIRPTKDIVEVSYIKK